jgi:nitrite reductase/ring-hydroxylating ferredoxin subunit
MNPPHDKGLTWHRVSDPRLPTEGNRLHVRVKGRYLTVFRFHGKLSVIDAICHHAGGPLTLGPVQDIEDLGKRVVVCPWHRFLVTIDEGQKAYQSVEIIDGKPVNTGWKLGKMVQRTHHIREDVSGIYVVSKFPFGCCLFTVFCRL